MGRHDQSGLAAPGHLDAGWVLFWLVLLATPSGTQ